jgi:hypothetical protein
MNRSLRMQIALGILAGATGQLYAAGRQSEQVGPRSVMCCWGTRSTLRLEL